jgi:hypothetical protein
VLSVRRWTYRDGVVDGFVDRWWLMLKEEGGEIGAEGLERITGRDIQGLSTERRT